MEILRTQLLQSKKLLGSYPRVKLQWLPHAIKVLKNSLLQGRSQTINFSVYIARHLGKGDGLLLSEDCTPNTRGALLNGLTDNLPTEDLSSLAEKIDSEKVDTLLVCREDLTRVGLSEAQLEKVKLVLLDTQTSATASHADVQLPALTVFEKNGTFL